MTTPIRSRRLLAGTVLTLLLAGGTAACGASGGSDADQQTTTTAAKATTTTTAAKTTTTVERTTTTDGGGLTTTTRVDQPAGDADRQDYVDALKDSFDAGGADSEQFYDAGQVDCLAEAYVDIIGVEALKDADIAPAELADGQGEGPLPKELGIGKDEATELYEQFDGCDIDLVSTFKKVFGTLSGKELTAAQSACIDKAITEENLRASFVADFSGKPLDPDPLDAASTCIGF